MSGHHVSSTTLALRASRGFSVVLAILSLSFLLNAPKAFAQPGESDEMKISIIGGPVVFDSFLAEGAAPGTEPSLVWDPSNSGVVPVGGVVPPGALGSQGLGLIQAAPQLGLNYVILAEPANELPDPNELPEPIYQSAFGPVVVSDVLINGLNNLQFQAGSFIPFIALLSSNNSDLNELVPLLPPGVPVVFENGQLQDLTPFMGLNSVPGLLPPVSVFVMSDVAVPEPSTFALAAVAGLGVMIYRRRK